VESSYPGGLGQGIRDRDNRGTATRSTADVDVGVAHAVDVPVVPGPAGIAPASRRRPPAHSGPRRALGVVRQRRALFYAAELRYPVARGLAHARPKKQELEEPARIELAAIRCDNPRCLRPVTRTRESARECLPLYQLSYGSSLCLDASPGTRLGAADAHLCAIDDASSRMVHVGSGGRDSNPLSGVHDPLCRSAYTTPYRSVEAPPERFELPTPWFVARCSRPLSYDGVSVSIVACRASGAGWWSTARAPEACTSRSTSETSGTCTRILPADNRLLRC
jgi:hypothetical protein